MALFCRYASNIDPPNIASPLESNPSTTAVVDKPTLAPAEPMQKPAESLEPGLGEAAPTVSLGSPKQTEASSIEAVDMVDSAEE